jgi:hypothetical protein
MGVCSDFISKYVLHDITGRHDIAELLLKVALSTKNNNHNFQWVKLELKHTHPLQIAR